MYGEKRKSEKMDLDSNVLMWTMSQIMVGCDGKKNSSNPLELQKS